MQSNLSFANVFLLAAAGVSMTPLSTEVSPGVVAAAAASTTSEYTSQLVITLLADLELRILLLFLGGRALTADVLPGSESPELSDKLSLR